MIRPYKTLALLGIASLLPAVTLLAQPPAATTAPVQPNEPTAKDVVKSIEEKGKAKASTDPIERIKEEGLRNSKVMETLGHLTDVIGPRLTASPAMKTANEWTRDRMASWGLENAHLEAWGPFGRGWTLKRFAVQVVEPQCIPLIAFPKAWSPGTDGALVADVVYLDAKTEAELARFKGKIQGAIVLTSAPVDVAARFEPLASRLNDGELLTLADAPEPALRGAGGRGGAGAAAKKADTARKGAASSERTPPGNRGGMMSPEMRAQMELARKKVKFAADEGAAMLVDVSREGDGGTLFVAAATVPGAPLPTPGGGGAGAETKRVSAYDKDAPKIPPQITMAKEHYNRMVRMIQQGEKLKLSVDLAVQFHDDDLMGYNTVAEIPGTDLKDEVVMLGGHMDSWHSGTGATDNAAGVSVAMEAVRILKALDLKPRRTIRVGLWSGEEQGLFGSRAFVTKHFGKTPAGGGNYGAPAATEKAEAKSEASSKPTEAFEKFSAYFNLDNGTGKIRGVYLQGNEAVRPTFRKWLQPFKEMGAATLSIANTGGTDHLSFDGVGLPGFQFIQDVIEYNSRTHHSNQDVYDRIQADDMKQASVIMAAFVYNTAMLDEKLPRKPEPAPAAKAATKAASRD